VRHARLETGDQSLGAVDVLTCEAQDDALQIVEHARQSLNRTVVEVGRETLPFVLGGVDRVPQELFRLRPRRREARTHVIEGSTEFPDLVVRYFGDTGREPPS